MRIPTLAIHLQSTAERSAFAPNKEDHLVPLLSLLSEELNGPAGQGDPRHSPKLLFLLSQQLNCEPSQIVDFELTLCDTQDACLGGAFEEFVFAPRCDNQLHCYVSTQSLITTANLNNANEDGVCMALLFDHEEVGSKSNEGAASPLLRDTIQRILNHFFEGENQSTKKNKLSATMSELLKITAATSIFFSADCAHAVHPNYAFKHEKQHSPHMGKGTVIKTNMSQKYATNSVTGFFVRELARQNKVGYFEEGVAGFVEIPVQEFVVRNDQPSGSTIGPITAGGSGLRTVDIGIPQLSMHSIREQCATKDLWSCYHLFRAFYMDGANLDKKLSPPDTLLF